MRAAYSRFCPLSTPSGCFDRFAKIGRISIRSKRFLSAASRSYCYGQKIWLSVAAGKAPTVGDRKRGAVGARVDFLDVVGVGGQIRAKCLCYNKRKMFHVTLFELFRAARGCCDFARFLLLRSKWLSGDLRAWRRLRLGWGNRSIYIGAHNNGHDNAFKWR